MPAPELWIVAGPNGAGKTTTVGLPAFRQMVSHCRFINPDAVTLEYLRAAGHGAWSEAPAQVLKETFVRAATDCESLVRQEIEAGGAVLVETVLSTRKYCPLVERVLELGGIFNLIYVALDSPALSAWRVAYRCRRGGHDVPLEKLAPRWHASLELLPWFAFRSSSFFVLNNSASMQGESPRLLLSGQEGTVIRHGPATGRIESVVSNFLTAFSAADENKRWKITLEDDSTV